MYFLLDNSIFVDPVSIFIYTWIFLDGVVLDPKLNCRGLLTPYKNITIFVFPIFSYALYIAIIFVNSKYYYDFFNDINASEKKSDIIFVCLYFWNVLLILLSCINMGLFLCQVNKISKSINA